MATPVRTASILNAGGTIDMAGGRGRKRSGGVARLCEEFEEEIGYYEDIQELSLDSSNFGSEDWKKIIHAVSREDKRKKEFEDRGGIIITHGSDTLEETALLLSLIFINHLSAPLVIVSSYFPPEQVSSDAQESFANAIKLALDVSTPPLPFVVLGDEIHLASRIEKIGGKIDDTSTPPKYLASYGGPVGHFSQDSITVFGEEFIEWAKPLSSRPYGAPVMPEAFAYVEHLFSNYYTPVEVFFDTKNRLMQREGPCGLIIEGFLPDNETVSDTIEELAVAGIPVWAEDSETALKAGANHIPAGLSARAARTKLSWLLSQGIALGEVNGRMPEDIAGEIFADETFPTLGLPQNDFYTDKEFVIAFPDMDGKVLADAICRLKDRKIESPSPPLPKGGRGDLIIEGLGEGYLPVGKEESWVRVKANLTEKHPELEEWVEANITKEDDIGAIERKLRRVGFKEEPNDIIKEVLMQSNEILRVLGKAVDEGIRVLITSRAPYSIPNLELYDSGNMLKVVGLTAAKLEGRGTLFEFAK